MGIEVTDIYWEPARDPVAGAGKVIDPAQSAEA